MPEINMRNADVLNFLIESVKKILAIDHVTENDDFFKLGGNSLAAIDLIDLIQEKYQIKLELIALFKNRTLIDLSEAIIEEILNKSEIAN